MINITYNWGFIGAGKMALNMAQEFQFACHSKIYSVASRTKKSAMLFSLLNKKPKVFLSVEEMLADPNLDAIYIATPNSSHYLYAKRALSSGKAVLCEKPFMINSGQARKLTTIAKGKKLFLMEGMWVRFLPIMNKLNQLLKQNVLGTIKLVRASFHVNLNVGLEHRLMNLSLGGGSLLDLGVYPISIIVSILGGFPSGVTSTAKLTSSGVDKNFQAVLEYPGGCKAEISAGFDKEDPQPIIIEGENGTIEIQAERTWKFTDLSISLSGNEVENYHMPMEGLGFIHQIKEVESCLAEGLLQSDKMKTEESIQVLEIMDKMRMDWGMQFPDENMYE